MISGLIGWIRRIAANPIYIYIVVSVVVLLSIGHYLGSHPGNFSPNEAAARSASKNLSQILNHPINAPHNILAYGLHSVGINWRTSLRLSSVLFWIAFVLCFYSLSRSMFGKSIGLMGALIFASTPLFFIMGRDGSAAIMLYSLVALMAFYTWSTRIEVSQLSLFCLLIAVALSLYVPGMLLWLLAALIISRKKLAGLIEAGEPAVVGTAVLLSLLIIAPLVIGLVKDWEQIKQLVLIPMHLAAPVTIAKNVAWMASTLFIKAPHASIFEVGRLPILNIVADALVIFGSFALCKAARPKFLVLLATIVYAIVLAGLNDNISVLALAVPALVIIATAGLRYLFIEWRSVFPRNPLAKNLALCLMWLVVAAQLIFGFRYGVSAWPDAPNTKNIYVVK